MQVTYFQRRPTSSNYSVERLFHDVRLALPPSVQASVVIARYMSQGIFPRLYNCVEAPFFQGDINHITGDVHYLTYFLQKKRTLLTILGCYTLSQRKGLRKKLFFWLWYLLPEKRSALISVISESTKQELLRYLPNVGHKIRVVPCPVSDSFTPVPKSFDSSYPVILQVGTGANKNLLRVAKSLKGFRCHLRVIGSLSSEQKSALAENKIDYSSIANISDARIVQEYNNSDMVIFVSTYEGFGLPILEAQAVGRPVITSNILSMPEVAGNGACIVDPYNVDSIEVGIQRIITDGSYRDFIIEQGRHNVKKFRPRLVAQMYVALYRELLAKL